MNESTQSPYSNTYIIQYGDGTSTLERVSDTYTKEGGERIHTVMDGETLQSIAFRYLGDSGLWAKIADTNSIIDPFTEIFMGKQIIIPNS